MWGEGSSSVKEISVRGQLPASVGIAQVFGYVQHFGVEVTYPLHFIISVRKRLQHLMAFVNDIGIDTFSLEFGNNAKDQPGDLRAGYGLFDPQEFEFMPEAESAIQVSKPLGMRSILQYPSDLPCTHLTPIYQEHGIRKDRV